MTARADEDRRLAWQRDPGLFARDALGLTLWAKQIEILCAIRDKKRVAVASCHESGKTFVASVAAIWGMLAHPLSVVVSTAPGNRQVQALLGAEIAARFVDMRKKVGGSEDAEIGVPMPTRTEWHMDAERYPKWYWTGFATSADTEQAHSTKFVGYHPEKGGWLFLIFDEAGGVGPPIWHAAEGLMSGRRTRHLAIGNPTDPTSEFAKCWRDPDWHKISISAFDCPNLQSGATDMGWGVTREYVDRMIRKYGEGSAPVESKVYGRFPSAPDDTLIGIGAVQAAIARAAPDCLHGVAHVSVGVDVARFGSDSTWIVVVCRKCQSILHAVERVGQDLMWTAGETIATARRFGLHESVSRQVAVDDTGLGGGVTDRMAEAGWRIDREDFGSGPRYEVTSDERFQNRRTELWWGIRDWVPFANLAGLSVPLQDQLLAELPCPKYRYRGDQTIALEPKADMKKRLGRSPDFADALALALAGRLRGAQGGFIAAFAASQSRSGASPRIGSPDRDPRMRGVPESARQSYMREWG